MGCTGRGGRTGGCARALAVVLVALGPLLAASGYTAEPRSEAAVKAAFLFRFAGYVDWPAGDGTRAPFEFAIVGNSEVAEELRRRLPGHAIAGRPALVREHERLVDAVDAVDAEVVYLGPGHARRLPQLADRLGGALVVGDEADALAAGATINFVRENDRVRFEVSLPAAERAGLRLRAGLLSVAARVQGHADRPGT